MARSRFGGIRLGSSMWMMVGLAAIGLTGYGFMGVVGRLPVADASALTMLYLIMNTIGPGVFAALEQETTRSFSAALAAGKPAGALLRRAVLAGTGLLVAAAVVIMALSQVFLDHLLGHRWELLWAVELCAVASAVAYLCRGLFAGAQRFSIYGVTLTVEGVARLLPCLVMAVLGVRVVGAYGFFCVAAPLFGVAVGAAAFMIVRARRRSAPVVVEVAVEQVADTSIEGVGTPGNITRFLIKGMLLVVGANILTQFVQNIVPIFVTGKLPGDPGRAVAFSQAFVLVRSPLMLFFPVQAMLLPALSAALTRGDLPFVRRRLRLIVQAILAVGIASLVFFTGCGQWLLTLLFGSKTRLSTSILAVMAAGTIVMMFVTILQPVLVALRRQVYFTVGWAAGTVVLCALLLLPGDPVTRALQALVAGPGLVLVAMVFGLARELPRLDRSGTTDSDGIPEPAEPDGQPGCEGSDDGAGGDPAVEPLAGR